MSDLYFDFLCGLVAKRHGFKTLLRYLYDTEFYSLIPNDGNRIGDGEHLRNIFIEERGPTGLPFLPKKERFTRDGCCLLEVLIGLSYRLESELTGGRYGRPAGEWFWVLIENLGLEWMDDVEFSIEFDTFSMVERRVRTFLDRQYSTDGSGGLFPLKNPQKDQRRVELWYQMGAWVIENYPI